MAWRLIRLDSPEETANALLISSERENSDTEIADPKQDLTWFLDGKESNPSLYFYLYDDKNGNTGACLLRRHYRPVNVTLGEFVVYRYCVYRFELWSSPIIKSNDSAEHVRIVEELLSILVRSFSSKEVLSIEGLATDSVLSQRLSTSGGERLCLQLGRSFMHQSISFPRRYEDYLAQMGKRSRKSVQYSRRKLEREFDVELFECDEPELIDGFLNGAISVSKKTYQWNLLGLGLRDKSAYVEILRHWARNADLRCFLLYCDGSPTAFMLGYIYRSRYYYVDVGYDPAWAKYSVGSVLQLLVIERLYEMPLPPNSFDFSTGYGEHKGRFGNRQQEEVNMLVFPITARNRFFIFIYKLVEATSNGLVVFFDMLGIKKQLKKLIRRTSHREA